jgi:hypothetical protein
MIQMKNLALIFLSLLQCANSFVILTPKQSAVNALKYTIIGPPEEEAEQQEQDPNAVGYKHQKTVNGAPETFAGYRDYDELEEEDVLNVDSFSHVSGASIMSGFHLTALCGDD